MGQWENMEAVKVGDQNYIGFFGFDAPFSNFHMVKGGFEFRGYRVSSAEQAFVIGKALTFAPEMADEIAKTRLPKDAKALGRKIPNFDKAIWDEVSEGIMVEVLREKFKDPKLQGILLQTGNAKLVEATPYDKIWGAGVGLDGDWWNVIGSNLLGKCLEQVRSEYQQAKNTTHTVDTSKIARQPQTSQLEHMSQLGKAVRQSAEQPTEQAAPLGSAVKRSAEQTSPLGSAVSGQTSPLGRAVSGQTSQLGRAVSEQTSPLGNALSEQPVKQASPLGDAIHKPRVEQTSTLGNALQQSRVEQTSPLGNALSEQPTEQTSALDAPQQPQVESPSSNAVHASTLSDAVQKPRVEQPSPSGNTVQPRAVTDTQNPQDIPSANKQHILTPLSTSANANMYTTWSAVYDDDTLHINTGVDTSSLGDALAELSGAQQL